jgi:hypothetical protein
MAVLIEGLSVVIRHDAIAQKYRGGMSAFLSGVPNETYCADGELSRVGFMAPADVKAYVEGLEANGLRYDDGKGAAVNVVVVDQRTGFRAACSWAGFTRVPLEGDSKRMIAVCYAIPTSVKVVALPEGWNFDTSLSGRFRFVETDKMENEVEFLRREDGVDVYRDRTTGKEFYVGRTTD